MMSQSGNKILDRFYSVFSCPKVNFIIPKDRIVLFFILALRKFTFRQEEIE